MSTLLLRVEKLITTLLTWTSTLTNLTSNTMCCKVCLMNSFWSGVKKVFVIFFTTIKIKDYFVCLL